MRLWIIVAALLVFPFTALAELRVGALTTTTRVLREDQPPAGREVRLFAARNETRGFQVLVRSDAPVAGLTVEPADLRGPDAAVLRADAAVLYRQHHIELTAGTYRNDQFKPGGYPDPLIPFRHPVTGAALTKARFVAAPFDLPASQTHGFWIDLPVPRDAKAGEYRGAYRVAAPSIAAIEIPVTLTVWDFALPDVPAMQTCLGSPAQRMRGYYQERAKAGKESEPADWSAVETQCALMLSQHRINATPPSGAIAPRVQADGSYAIPASEVAALREFVDLYHINAFMTPNPMRVVKDPELERDKLRAWLKAWDQAAAQLARPQVTFFTYLLDEPNDEEAYKTVRQWGKPLRDANTVVKVLVVEQPQTQDPKWGDLYGAVDLWCPLFSLFQDQPAADRQTLGETLWTYTALCQGKPTPWWHIDHPLLNYRAPSWIAWRYRIRGLLYWGGMSYWKEVNDPWLEGNTYGAKTRRVFNGEGTLVYPARAAGYEGLAPSLRLKALRDGIQDYDYLALLERPVGGGGPAGPGNPGAAAEAQKIVLPLAGSWYEWDKDPAAYDRARAKLAELIVMGRTSGGR